MLCCIVCFLPGKLLKLPNFLTTTITICNISMSNLTKTSSFDIKWVFLRRKFPYPIRRRNLVRRSKVKRQLTQTFGLPELLNLRYIFWEEMSWNEGVQWKWEIPPSAVESATCHRRKQAFQMLGNVPVHLSPWRQKIRKVLLERTFWSDQFLSYIL